MTNKIKTTMKSLLILLSFYFLEGKDRESMIKNSDWIVINAITYKIHAIQDFDDMRMKIMEDLGHLIDFDASSFYLRKVGEDIQLEKPLGIHYSKKDMMHYVNEWMNIDYSEGLMTSGKNIVYRESDIMDDHLRIHTDYYKAVYDVQGWHYSIHMNISYNETFLGVLSFFRKKGEKNFSFDDTFILEMIKDHLALRLFEEYKHRQSKKIRLEDCGDLFNLSNKENEVLQLLVKDMYAMDIADQLSISMSTLRKHCNHIYQKMGVSQRVQLFDKIEL